MNTDDASTVTTVDILFMTIIDTLAVITDDTLNFDYRRHVGYDNN